MKKRVLASILIMALSPNFEAFATDKKDEKKVVYKTEKLIKQKNNKEKNSAKKNNFESGFADVIAEFLPSVVSISVLQDKDFQSEKSNRSLIEELPQLPAFDNFRKQLEEQISGDKKKRIFSVGSGFLISKDGFVVTNNHVINQAKEISIGTNDGAKYQAKIIAIDEKSDLALLKIEGKQDFKFVTFGDSNQSRIGDFVLIAGNPYGLGNSVSLGIISARSRNINSQGEDLIQTDAAINKGNSGGPMFNIAGEVIGVNNAIFSPSGVNVGIGFAIPANDVAKIIKQLREKGEVVRGWIGISIQEVDAEISKAMKLPKISGVFINEVTKNGPADKSGIEASDIILKFNDDEINSLKSLTKAVANSQIDEEVEILLWRNGREKTAIVKIEKSN